MAERVVGDAQVASESVEWDAAAGAFVRLLFDCAGRILSRADLDPPVKRAVLRHLFISHLRRAHRSELYRLLRDFGLLTPMKRGGGFLAMPALVCTAKKLDAAEALAHEVGVSVRDFVLLAWVVVLIFNRPGVALPALENIDADYPYFPAVVPGEPPPYFCAETLLTEIEAEHFAETITLEP
ncbi:hypothetical protein [Methylosinus sp. KRF6]|uniref:hypothetical protein n=1 Tax=Methylosinus sp. KRF6 TaxID=2846853 RepID=UPI001C0CD6A5|nr:hypothetical protein [Methylosinus sp. KRF6]MBU3888588.1 hypothetical protein [Methylosinus sp. KRF6]